METPTMLYKLGPGIKIKGVEYSIVVVDATEVEGMVANGWSDSPTGCEKKADAAPPTRSELEQKATELGIEFTESTRDSTLAKRIGQAL